MDYSKITLGEMLSTKNEAIRRNAIGILKQLQKELPKQFHPLTETDLINIKLGLKPTEPPKIEN